MSPLDGTDVCRHLSTISSRKDGTRLGASSAAGLRGEDFFLPAAYFTAFLAGPFLPTFLAGFFPASVFPARCPAEATKADFFFFFFLEGVVGAGGVRVAGASSGMSLLAIGEPSPVHASHPGPAEKAPLFPSVMSWNANRALAA